MRRSVARHALVAMALAALGPPALAHVEQAQAAGLLSGLAHPVSGLDHVLAMVAVGLWGAQLGAPAIWLLPLTFPIVMALGGLLGLLGIALPGVELGIAASAILLGAAVMTERRCGSSACRWRGPWNTCPACKPPLPPSRRLSRAAASNFRRSTSADF